MLPLWDCVCVVRQQISHCYHQPCFLELSNYFMKTSRCHESKRLFRYIFIGPESDHCLLLSLTHWLIDSLTDWLLFSKLDWCNSGMWRFQLKTCWCCNCCWWGSVGNNLLQISKLRFGQKPKLLFRFWAQGLFKVLMLKFRSIFCRRGYEVESWSRCWS